MDFSIRIINSERNVHSFFIGRIIRSCVHVNRESRDVWTSIAFEFHFCFKFFLFFLSFQDWTIRDFHHFARRLKIRLSFHVSFSIELFWIKSIFVSIYRFYKAIKKKILGYSFVLLLCQPWIWLFGFLLEILQFTPRRVKVTCFYSKKSVLFYWL